MAFANGFSKRTAELVYGVHEGDTIRITRLDDPYTPETYVGREGTVTHIDSMGQLHGTWGGLAVIPGEDGFTIIKKKGE